MCRPHLLTIAQRNIINANSDAKLEKEIMGHNTEDNKACGGYTAQDNVFPFVAGDKFTIDGKEYKLVDRNLKYLNTNGDPNTLYAVLRPANEAGGKAFLMTHRQIMREHEVFLTERFVTPAQIINGSPCVEGMYGLGVAMGIFTTSGNAYTWSIQQLTYHLTVDLQAKGKLNEAVSVAELWRAHNRAINGATETFWLLWMAQLLNLVPKGSRGPDHATLKRLLGIK